MIRPQVHFNDLAQAWDNKTELRIPQWAFDISLLVVHLDRSMRGDPNDLCPTAMICTSLPSLPARSSLPLSPSRFLLLGHIGSTRHP
jgi:hypothetical protein